MLSIQLFRHSREHILAGLAKKHFGHPGLVDRIIDADNRRRKLQSESDGLAAFINSSSKEIGKLMQAGSRAEADALKAEVSARKEEAQRQAQEVAALEKEVDELLVQLPNMPHSSVPEGKTPEQNEVVRSHGELPDLNAQKLPHWE